MNLDALKFVFRTTMKMGFCFILCSYLFFAPTQASPSVWTSPGVWNGQRVTTARPYHSVFHFVVESDFGNQRGQSDCSAVLVHPQILLTVAHCLTDRPKWIYGLNGSHRRGMNRFLVENQRTLPEHGWIIKTEDVEAMIPHPEYRMRGHNEETSINRDIGIIKLKTPLTQVVPAKMLPLTTPQEGRLLIGKNATLVGFGSSNIEFNPRHENWGYKLFGKKTLLQGERGFFRTSAGTQGPLEGDSGGGLFLEDSETLIGIITGATSDHVDHPRTLANFSALNAFTLCKLEALSGVAFSGLPCSN